MLGKLFGKKKKVSKKVFFVDVEDLQEETKKGYDGYKLDMVTWVANYGSAHLKELVKLGYSNTRVDEMYIKERSTMEFPKGILSIRDISEWGSIDVPCLDALYIQSDMIEKGFDVQVKLSRDDAFRTAVIVENYLDSKRNLLFWV